MFESYGPIQSCKVMGEDKGESKGFGFVCFEDPKSAVKAASELHCDLHHAQSDQNPEERKAIEEGLYVRRAVKKE